MRGQRSLTAPEDGARLQTVIFVARRLKAGNPFWSPESIPCAFVELQSQVKWTHPTLTLKYGLKERVFPAQEATDWKSAEFPISFMYPLDLTGSNKVPLTWSMSLLDLQKQPALDARQANKME